MASPAFIFWRESDRRFYVAVLALWALFVVLVLLLNFVFAVRRIDGPSMEPTLMEGDRVLITRGYEVPSAGDIVSFDSQDSSGEVSRLIKRVVAVPGDTVEIVGDTAFVNGQPSEAAPDALIGAESFRLGPMTVPEGNVYVLGDNRPVSLDSRWIGFVPIATIHGKAVATIFPLHRVGGIDD